jgi:hypothetical protein
VPAAAVEEDLDVLEDLGAQLGPGRSGAARSTPSLDSSRWLEFCRERGMLLDLPPRAVRDQAAASASAGRRTARGFADGLDLGAVDNALGQGLHEGRHRCAGRPHSGEALA